MSSPQNFAAQQTSWFDRFFRDSAGNIAIVQPPNLPVLVAVGATVLQTVLPSGTLQTAVALVAFGTWYTWAWLELFDGASYFRRSLGLITLVGLLALVLN